MAHIDTTSRIYSLNTEIQLPARITKDELLKAMDGHIIDEGSIMGTYTR